MPNRKKTLPQITVALPTYVAGPSLISTLESIYNQSVIDQVKEVIVVIDGKRRLSPEIMSQVEHPKLRVIGRVKRKGQSSRMNDIFKLTTTPLLALTNDDVIWDKTTLARLVSKQKITKADLITSQAVPLKQNSLLEWIISLGAELTHKVSKDWNNFSNYLSCNGRLVLLSQSLFTEVSIPEKLWNNDAYLYLVTIINGFKHVHQPQAKVWYRSPATLNEHLKQSHKFQLSQWENQYYFDQDLSSFYKLPTHAFNNALLHSLLHDPMRTILFVGLTLYTRFTAHKKRRHSVGYWATDTSTKVV